MLTADIAQPLVRLFFELADGVVVAGGPFVEFRRH